MDNDRIHVTFSLDAIGFILFVVFLVLKLVGVSDMSWFWVFFPLWLPIALSCLFLLIVFLVLVIKDKIESTNIKRNKK